MRLRRRFTLTEPTATPGAMHKTTGAPLTHAGVEVLRAGRLQHFSKRLVDIGVREGWLMVGPSVMTRA